MSSDNNVHPINNGIKRGAQVYAAITALIRANKEPVTVPEMEAHYSLRQLAVDQNSLQIYCGQMRKKNILTRIRVHRKDQPNVRYGYELFDAATHKPHPHPAPTPAPVVAPAPLPADVSIDIIRDTGKLRISFRGITLEIGVV